MRRRHEGELARGQHAAATGELQKLVPSSPTNGTPSSPQPFFFPTGLTKLTSTYCSRELSAPISQLKADFGALFDQGRAPFRALPLTAAAATYAAADVWHTYLVYEALWPALQTAGAAVQVALASETRAGEFRDVPGGREKWEQAVASHRAARIAKRSTLPIGGIASPNGVGVPLPIAPSDLVNGAPAAAIASGGGAVEAVTTPASPKENPNKKKRVVSGPACECCDVRFTGDAQLAEHKQGRRHCIAQAAFDAPSAPTLVVECRHGPIEQAALNAAFSPHGAIGKIELHASDPSGKPSRPVRNGKEGPWFATIVYRESRAAAKCLGQRYMEVSGMRVLVEPAGRA